MKTLEGIVAGLLADKKMKRKDLAKKMGIVPETLKKKLTGKCAFSIDDARVIATELGDDDPFAVFDDLCRAAIGVPTSLHTKRN